jgi:hypothetical protein
VASCSVLLPPLVRLSMARINAVGAERKPDVDMFADHSPEAGDSSAPERPDAGPRAWLDEGDATHSYLFGAAFGLDAATYHHAEQVLLERDAWRRLILRDGWDAGRRICTDPYVGDSACSAGDAQYLYDGMWVRDDVSGGGCSREGVAGASTFGCAGCERRLGDGMSASAGGCSLPFDCPFGYGVCAPRGAKADAASARCS